MNIEVSELFKKVDTLPQDFQNNLAFFWNEDLKNEINFDKKLSDTSNILDSLAQIALKEFKEGKTVEKGFDEL
ncbi:MAG: hypothetical protein NTW25_13435 [Candidatus Kapabacteria bacterium]|jgi:hypothetical protein|nr:hypothetical protein [Candidatus Kapabacteria bacterium]